MKNYWELLRDTRWQRKRLEVMERAGWACEDCGDKDTTFNVHHTHYVKGRKPWEYEDHELKCLCENCHACVTKDMAEMAQIIGGAKRHIRDMLLGFARVRSWENERVFFDSPAVAAGIAMAIGGGLSTERVIEMADGASTVDVGDLFIEMLSLRHPAPAAYVPDPDNPF